MAAAAVVQGPKYEVTHNWTEDLFPKLALDKKPTWKEEADFTL